ncbi:2,3,4,5-tetrahydropyridine-2,6-dicarboxylate N-succinyltransferase [soil metagenome]
MTQTSPETLPSTAASSQVAADPTLPLQDRLARISAGWPSEAPGPGTAIVDDARGAVAELLSALEAGDVRAAVPDETAPGGWRAQAWVKAGILLGFRLPGMTEHREGPIFAARDRSAYWVVDILSGSEARHADASGSPWRIVPGGTTVRTGAHLEPGVTIMPPSYVNVGAWIGRGTMVDSHVLVGSCAQVGSGVHLGAGTQIGGVLEPPGARPVVVEDDAFVGGNCGLYEGVVVGRGAVIGAGVVLTGQGRLIDLVNERELTGTPEEPLLVPPGAVVVPGTRPAAGGFARERGISLAVPVIVKQRDEGTAARVALEDALR